MTTWFGVLGPLEIRDRDGGPLPVTRPRHRSLVAVLLAEPNRVVPVDEVIDRVWSGHPPVTARPQVHGMVSAVRRALPDGERVLRTESSGYLLEVTAATLDVLAFDEAIAAARAGPDAARHLRAALGMWRGAPFAGVTGEFLGTPRRVLTERYLAAAEHLADLELERGNERAAAGVLRPLVDAYPLREGLRRRLMIALYRCGDAAGALRVYRAGRRTLAEEHGLDPSPALHELAERIQTGDRSLARTHGPARRVPRQLPLAPARFTGRVAELAALDGLLRDQVRVIRLVGTGGVGKTALATLWAHRVAEKFPDGQLYLDLRGYDEEAPLPVAAALAYLLRALGVAAEDVPADLSGRSALFQSTVDGRRILLLLDNARDARHVRPLLPRSPSCLAMVTSRDSLAELRGTRVVTLKRLSVADGIALLAVLLGPRVDADPESAARLAERCARLPLALRVAAERAVERVDAPLSVLAAELADERGVLRVLDTGDDPHTAVATVLSWSYRQLRPDQARAFRLLGLHRGAHVDVTATAALLDVPQGTARDLLTGLHRVHLLETVGEQRFSMHELLQVFAAERAGALDPEPDRRAALHRVGRYYLAGAAAAMDALYPAEKAKRPAVDRLREALNPPARRWLDVELPNLLRVDDAQVIALSVTIWRHLETLGRYDDAAALCERAIAVARREGDAAAHAFALTVTGQLRWRQGQFAAAHKRLVAAAAAYRSLRDRAGTAWVQLNLGVVAERTRRYGVAAGHLREAAALYTSLGDDGGLADALGNLGVVYEQTGEYDLAARLLNRAYALHLDGDNRVGQANALGNLGIVHYRTGRHEQAVFCLRQALALFRASTDRAGEAEALAYLGASLHALGDAEEAREHLERAMVIARDINSRRVQANAMNGLGELAFAAGDRERSVAAHTVALRHARAVGDTQQRTRAEAGLAAGSAR